MTLLQSSSVRDATRRRRVGAASAALAAFIAVLATFCLTATASAATGTYVVGNAASGDAAWIASPDSNPAGVNLTNCVPSAAHPDPVVLVPGTTSTVIASYASLGPILANAGYCVYGLNYGATSITTATHGSIGALGDIPTSAAQLATFVNQVLASTNAKKVDIVGWSQGGMMPRYYLKFLGGASKVDQLIGLAPSNHGTTLDGMVSLLSLVQSATGVNLLSLAGCTACVQQNVGSALLTNLNAGGDTVSGVNYTVIESKDDEVITPYTNAFLSGASVKNILLQNACPLDMSDHMAMDYDANAIQYVLNALQNGPASFRPKCYVSLPLIGTPTIATDAKNFG